jgi:hypothetical protein
VALMGPAKRTSTRTLARIAVAGAALVAAAAASACLFGTEIDTVEIPDDIQTSSEAYTLLYSTLGYDSAGAKRVLIRQNDVDAVPAQGLAFGWRLVDRDGRERASGLAQFAGTAWGVPLWAADFTGVDRPGEYRLLVESPVATLATPPFRIDDYLLSRATFESIALDSAEQRAAPLEADSGFFDSNTRTGSAYAHAYFLLGLLDLYEYRRFSLTAAQRERLLDGIERAVDYILLLTDPATGEIAHSSDRRPRGDDQQDTAQGALALARYARVFQREDAPRAQRAYRLARLADQWVRDELPVEYPAAFRVAVAYDLARYSNDPSLLEAAYDAARELAEGYDVRELGREGSDPTVYFETLHRLAQDAPGHPDRPLWIAAAARNAAHYTQALALTPFMVIPTGIHLEGAPSPAEQWDAAPGTLPLGEGEEGAIGTEWFLARAIDAMYIAEMADGNGLIDEGDLYESAAANLLWVAGLNPGVDSGFVPAPRTGSPFEAASFVLGAPGRAVMPWEVWEFQRRSGGGAIAAGFVGAFSYDGTSASGDTSLVRDGLWLRAVVRYEDTLHAAGPAAPAPDDAAQPASELVVGAEADPAGTALFVRVTGVDGEPVSGAEVFVLWCCAVAPDVDPVDAAVLASCVTAAEGTCMVAAPAGAPDPPRTIAVTNVQHPRLRFEPSEQSMPEPVVFD